MHIILCPPPTRPVTASSWLTMSHSLSRRLQLLLDAYKSTLNQIQQLQSLPVTATDTDRLDLANDIHESLREQEDTLELLRQELDDIPAVTRRGSVQPSNTEHERNADLVARLTEDIRSARARFRRAQLQTKRNADDAKRKERELLFKRNHDANENDGAPVPPGRRPGQEKLTQEDIARNASEDVTRALRRTHDLMTANIQQSQFAQQTLDESQDALRGLAENYGGTADILKNSRSLVGQLVKSNKSDTWYLQTTFYMLAITISWLVFRRILYGPMWWLVWQPLKLMWWTTLMALGMVGVGSKGAAVGNSTLSLSSQTFAPTSIPGQQVTVDIGSIFGSKSAEIAQSSGVPNVEEIGGMAERAADYETNVDDISEEERQRQESMPRNPKKRMMEVEVDTDRPKDEL